MGKVYLIGDLHQNFHAIRKFDEWNEHSQTLDDVMICLGDFGGNFAFDWHDRNFKEKLGKYHMTFFVIRGNHEKRPHDCFMENSKEWDLEFFFDNIVYVEKKYPYIKYASDQVEFYKILGQKTLVIPGAYSVDKYYRLANRMTWFENEQLSEYEKELGRLNIAENKKGIGIVLSHTCPAIYMPTDLFLKNIDQSMVDKSMEQYLGEIEYMLPGYKLWAWGHYHETRIYPTYEGRQPLMMFDDAVFDLNQFLATRDAYKALKYLKEN